MDDDISDATYRIAGIRGIDHHVVRKCIDTVLSKYHLETDPSSPAVEEILKILVDGTIQHDKQRGLYLANILKEWKFRDVTVYKKMFRNHYDFIFENIDGIDHHTHANSLTFPDGVVIALSKFDTDISINILHSKDELGHLISRKLYEDDIFSEEKLLSLVDDEDTEYPRSILIKRMNASPAFFKALDGKKVFDVIRDLRSFFYLFNTPYDSDEWGEIALRSRDEIERSIEEIK